MEPVAEAASLNIQVFIDILHVLGKPNFFKTPAFLIDKVLGERALLVTEGQKVHPRVLLNNDFKYLYPTLEQAIEDIYS